MLMGARRQDALNIYVARVDLNTFVSRTQAGRRSSVVSGGPWSMGGPWWSHVGCHFTACGCVRRRHSFHVTPDVPCPLISTACLMLCTPPQYFYRFATKRQKAQLPRDQ